MDIRFVLLSLLMLSGPAADAGEPMPWVQGWDWLDLLNIAPAERVHIAQADKDESKDLAVDSAPSAAALVDAMQQYYDDATSYSADFRQVYTEINGLEKKSSGVVWFKKPGKMRWDYANPEEKYLISDGDTFWAWEPQYKQYCEQSLQSSQLPTALTFLAGEGDLKKDFDVAIIPSKRPNHRLQLTPKTPSSSYANLEFDIDPATHRVESVTIIDALGNINALTFSGVEINETLDDANFKFKVPADATHLCE